MPVTTPDVIPEPFATSGDRASIPDTTGSAGRASWSLGFPPDTMEAKIAGGIPPDGRDFNGVLFELSAHAFFTQAGQPFRYSSAVSTAAGGYGLGAVLGSSDGKTLWYNLLNGNTVDPDGASTNWVSAFTYGSITISGLTGGTRTLTRLEARFGLIVLTGALVANQALVFPNDIANWRIVNLTSGAFTVTARTSTGTGVTIPQGDYSTSVGVYGNGDPTSPDIYLDVPPVSLPIAVTPDANTLLKRDNVGDGFCRYFNGSAAPESVTVANVLVTNDSDGYYRKVSIASLQSQMALSSIGGQVTNGQVPQSAVSQFFTTAVTVAGRCTVLPDGTRIARGTINTGDIPGSPTPQITNISLAGMGFIGSPVITVTVQDQNVGSTGNGGVFTPCIKNPSNAGFTVYLSELNNFTQNITLHWIAIGT